MEPKLGDLESPDVISEIKDNMSLNMGKFLTKIKN